MFNIRYSYLLLLLFVWAPSGGFAQNTRTEFNYSVKQWTVQDGLPVNLINDILQTQKGYIWLATYEGLVRFDGVRFTTYRSYENPGLPSNRLVDITEAADGTLWILTEQGHLVRYDGRSFHHLNDREGPVRGHVWTLYTDREQTIWIASDSGIYGYKESAITRYRPDIIDHHVRYLFVASDGVIWYSREDRQLLRLEGKEPEIMSPVSVHGPSIPDFFEDRDGSIWFTAQSVVYHYKDGEVRRMASYTGDPKRDILGFVRDMKGSLWVVPADAPPFILETDPEAAGNIPKYQNEDIVFYEFETGLIWMRTLNQLFRDATPVVSLNYITGFFRDLEGSFWISTEAEGLYQLKPNIFKVLNKNSGLPGKNIYPVYEDPKNGDIWIGSYDAGLMHLSSGGIHSFGPAEGMPSGHIRAILRSGNDVLYVGTMQSGLFWWSGGRFRVHELTRNFGIHAIHALYEDKLSRLWVGSNLGVSIIDGDSVIHYSREDGLSHNYIRYIQEAPDGSFWLASNGGGIMQLKEGRVRPVKEADGLSSNLVRALLIEPAGTNHYIIWVGTEDKGLNRVEVKEDGSYDIEVVGREDGLYDNVIHKIIDDRLGRFWMSTNRGIFRVEKSDLEAFHRGEIEQVISISYTEEDGMSNREANGGVQQAGMLSSHGELWFPTQDGLVIVNPAEIKSNTVPPPVVIEQVKAGLKTITVTGSDLSLEAGERNFQIDFTALSFLVPSKVRFRYMLEGFDPGWTDPGSRRTAFYTNIPSGTYTFRVAAANNDGVWNEAGASLGITIQPYFTETVAFYVITGLGVIIAFIGGIRLHTYRLKLKERKLKKLVDRRTEELSLEKQKTEEQAEKLMELDEAKSRFFANISHEFRTPLTLIIGPLKRFLSKDFKKLPDDVNEQHHMMLRNSQRLLRLINQVLDLARMESGEMALKAHPVEIVAYLHGVTEMFRMTCEQRGLTLLFQSTISRADLYIDHDKMEKVFGNLLSNAVKFTPNGGSIYVSMDETENEVLVKVRDSGIGIAPDKLPRIFDRFFQVDSSGSRAVEGSGIGLALAKEFVELHYGSIEVTSSENAGTTFTVRLPKGKVHLKGSEIDENVPGPVLAEEAVHLSHNVGPDPDDEVQTVIDIETPEQDEPTILIVEDNADMRSFIRRTLSDHYHVLEAANGTAALEVVGQHLPDVIITDLMMPGMDGLQFNRELKKDAVLSCIPVMFLTAKAGEQSELEGYREGADNYLTKPFSEKMLLTRIRNLIDSRMRLRNLLGDGKAGMKIVEEELSEFVQKVRDYILEHLSDPGLSVNTIADNLYIDRSTLYRKLTKEMGITANRYIQQLRLQKAGELLEDKAGTISEIAYGVGFNSLAYFSNVFKRYYNVSPSEYAVFLESGGETERLRD